MVSLHLSGSLQGLGGLGGQLRARTPVPRVADQLFPLVAARLRRPTRSSPEMKKSMASAQPSPLCPSPIHEFTPIPPLLLPLPPFPPPPTYPPLPLSPPSPHFSSPSSSFYSHLCPSLSPPPSLPPLPNTPIHLPPPPPPELLPPHPYAIPFPLSMFYPILPPPTPLHIPPSSTLTHSAHYVTPLPPLLNPPLPTSPRPLSSPPLTPPPLNLPLTLPPHCHSDPPLSPLPHPRTPLQPNTPPPPPTPPLSPIPPSTLTIACLPTLTTLPPPLKHRPTLFFFTLPPRYPIL